MLILLLVGAGIATPAVRAYGNISFATVGGAALSLSVVNPAQTDLSLTTNARATEE